MTPLTYCCGHGQQHCSSGHSLTLCLTTALILALLLRGSAGDSTLQFPHTLITSAPVVYGCGFYTLSYQFWCDPTAVTAYVALFNSCNMSSPLSAQNGGSSSLLNSSTTVLPSGLVTAPACPPATEFISSLSCAARTTCEADWSGPDTNSNMLCLILIAGAPGFTVQSTCDLAITGQTTPPVPAAAPPSGTLKNMTWWQILLIVVAGLLTLLVGVGLLMCMWRSCCRSGGGAVEPAVAAAEPIGFTSSHMPDKPFVLSTATATPAAAGAGTASLTKALPPEVARMTPAAVLKIYSDKLRDTNMDNPNLFVPDDNSKVPQISKASTLLPGAVPKDPEDNDPKPKAEAKSAAPPPKPPIGEQKPGTGQPTEDTARSAPQRPQQPAELVSEPHSAATPPAPPPPPPPQQIPAPVSQPAAAAGATTAGAAVAGAAAAAAPPVARSKSLFSRFFGKKQPDEVAAAATAGAAAAGSPGAVDGNLGSQSQGLLPEGTSRSSMSPPPAAGVMPPHAHLMQQQQQLLQPYNQQLQSQMPQLHQQQQGAGGAYPWPGPGHPDAAVQPPPFPPSGPYSPSSPGGVPPMAPHPMQTVMMQQQQPYMQSQQSFSAGSFAPPNQPRTAPGPEPGLLQPQSGFGGMLPSPDDPYSGSGRLPEPHQLQRAMSGNYSMSHGSPPLSPQASGLQPLAPGPGMSFAPHPIAGGPLREGGEDAFSPGGALSRQHSMMQAQQPQLQGSLMNGDGEAALPPPRGLQPLQPLQPLQRQQTPGRAGSFGRAPLDPPLPQPLAEPSGMVDGPTGHDFPRGSSLDAPAQLLRSPSAMSAGSAAGPWPLELKEDGASAGGPPRQPLLQPLQPLKPPARGLQPLQPLPSLREPAPWPPPPAQAGSEALGDSTDEHLAGPLPPKPDDRAQLRAGPDEPEDPLEASLSAPPPRGLPPPLPSLGRGGLEPLRGPSPGGGLPPPRPPGGLAPLAPPPGPRKLTPMKRTDDDDDDDVGAAAGGGGAGAGGGGMSLRGEPSFGDERADTKQRGADSAIGGLEDLDEDDQDGDRPAPARRGGFM